MAERTVWKFPLTAGDEIFIPGRIIHVGVDPIGDQHLPTVWSEVDPNAGPSQPGRVITFFGTGHPIDPDLTEHLGSVVTPVGLVWHAYAMEET